MYEKNQIDFTKGNEISTINFVANLEGISSGSQKIYYDLLTLFPGISRYLLKNQYARFQKYCGNLCRLSNRYDYVYRAVST